MDNPRINAEFALRGFDQSSIDQSRRVHRLIPDVVKRQGLDLSGLCVLTEAGSSHFALTPAIALAAGASRVLAVTRDSSYGRATEIIAASREIIQRGGYAGPIDFIVGRPDEATIASADIVTN